MVMVTKCISDRPVDRSVLHSVTVMSTGTRKEVWTASHHLLCICLSTQETQKPENDKNTSLNILSPLPSCQGLKSTNTLCLAVNRICFLGLSLTLDSILANGVRLLGHLIYGVHCTAGLVVNLPPCGQQPMIYTTHCISLPARSQAVDTMDPPWDYRCVPSLMDKTTLTLLHAAIDSVSTPCLLCRGGGLGFSESWFMVFWHIL